MFMRYGDNQTTSEKLSVISCQWNKSLNRKGGAKKNENVINNFGIQKHVAAASIVLHVRALDCYV